MSAVLAWALAAALPENERAIPCARAFDVTDISFHRVLTKIPGIFLAAIKRWWNG